MGDVTTLHAGDMMSHCRACTIAEVHPGTAEEAAWPRCCGMRMTLSFTHGHPGLVLATGN